MALAPRRQFLLREGAALLDWTEPAGARSLLAPRGDLRGVLAALPPTALAALLLGDGPALTACLEGAVPGPAGGALREARGRLGGHPATLRLRGGRARALDWDLPQGRVDLHWPALAPGARAVLRVALPDGSWLRVQSRLRPAPALGPEDWLFLGDDGNPP